MHLVAVGSDCRHVTLHVYPRPRSPITLATSEFASVGSVGGVVVAKPDPVGYLRADRKGRGCKGGFTPHLVHGSVPQQRASSRDLHPGRRSRRRPGAGRVLPGGRRTRAAREPSRGSNCWPLGSPPAPRRGRRPGLRDLAAGAHHPAAAASACTDGAMVRRDLQSAPVDVWGAWATAGSASGATASG